MQPPSIDTENVIGEMRAQGVIPAVRTSAQFESAISLPKAPFVILLKGDLQGMQRWIGRARKSGKELLVHADLIAGVGKDESGMQFLSELGVFGILTTRSQLLRSARKRGLFTIQRFFLIDSEAFTSSVEQAKKDQADMVELLPGVLPSSIYRDFKEKVGLPFLCGGFVKTIQDTEELIEAGATGVTSSHSDLWQYHLG
ncbi:MAG: glycerol-3-phosphate responsive antiterminator [Firmicutes bacterium]|nr:glycerol-3-phosphate responsive antiterminator [Bacillota bacterium]